VERVLFAPRELPPPGPDAAQDPRPYAAWVPLRETRRAAARTPTGPHLKILMVLGGAPTTGTAATLQSLHAQTVNRWSLTIVAPEPELGSLARLVRSAVPRRSRRRIALLGAPAAAPANELLHLGLSETRGVGGALIFSGDVWAPDTVALLGVALQPDSVVYADEDRINSEGGHEDPRLKPEYSPDFLASSAYLGRPIAFSSELTGDLPAFTSSNGAALERDFASAVCRRARHVLHISEVLCHRTGDVETPAVARRCPPRPRPAVKVSIVIPFRDQPRFLRTCLDSVRATVEEDLELILIDNGSSEPETMLLLQRLGDWPSLQVLTDAGPFNWARLNNAGARLASGDVLLFMNNDVEAVRPGWLSILVAHALRSDVGAVGARLLYPDRRLQHCGIVVGLNGAAGHPLVGLRESERGYLGMATSTRECSAVTGACLATRRGVFERLGGFDESLGIDLNDVDFCLRAGREGHRVIYAADAELLHHESPSRGTAGATGDIVEFVQRWAEYIGAGDPYLSPHLTRADSSCALAQPGEVERWHEWFATLAGA
jgi:O-antigen biosynthesis protein